MNATVSATWTKPGQYLFQDVPVQLSILDVEGRGFATVVTVRGANGAIVNTTSSSAGGLVSIALDEGNYTIEITRIGEPTL